MSTDLTLPEYAGLVKRAVSVSSSAEATRMTWMTETSSHTLAQEVRILSNLCTLVISFFSTGRDLSGNKRTAPQSFDQTLTSGNAALARNCKAKFDDKNGGDAGDKWKKGEPIRVVRGWKGKKHSKYAPEDGCR